MKKWVKRILILFPLMALFIIWRFIALAAQSNTMVPPPFLSENEGLPPCKSQGNCRSSSNLASAAYFPPIHVGKQTNVMERVQKEIQVLGGVTVTSSQRYLRAEFKSALFGFVDDVEVLLSEDTNLLQVRSASRVGKSDLGANQIRLEKLRAALLK